jgi:hypothetical protein
VRKRIVKYCAGRPVPAPSILVQVGTALRKWKKFWV